METGYSLRQIRNFEAKFDKTNPDECWEWQAGKSDGYGVFNINGKAHKAHRVSFKMYNGPLSDDLCVCHKCDNPRCVNPNHLFSGTKKDNAEDRDSKGRNINHSGMLHGNYTLTSEVIKELRDLAKCKLFSQMTIARWYNTSQRSVSRALNGQSRISCN